MSRTVRFWSEPGTASEPLSLPGLGWTSGVVTVEDLREDDKMLLKHPGQHRFGTQPVPVFGTFC